MSRRRIKSGLRGLSMALMTVVLLGPYLLLLSLWPQKAPIVSGWFFRGCVHLTGLRLNVTRAPAPDTTMYVVNHASYLDIPILGGLIQGGVFVSKSEVADWPLFGYLARIANTVFLKRSPRYAKQHRAVLAKRMQKGQSLILFPEGTSTDGGEVRPFKSTLFSALEEEAYVQPVTVAYARRGDGERMTQAERQAYTWFGDMELVPHLTHLLGLNGCQVDVTFHNPVRLRDFADRKQLAKRCGETVARQLTQSLGTAAPSADGMATAPALPQPVAAE